MFDNPVCGSASEHRHRVGQAGHRRARRLAGLGRQGAVGRDIRRRRQDLDAVQGGRPRARARARSRCRPTVRRSWRRPWRARSSFSKDKGATWARAEGLPDAEKSPDWAPVPFRPAADRVNPKKFYVLDARNGQAYASADGGAHFTASPTGLPAPSRIPVQLRIGAGRPRLRGRHLAHQLQRAQSLGRLGKDLQGGHQRDRGVRPRLRQGGRRQEVSGGVSHRQDRRRAPASSARMTSAPPGCASTTTATSTASARSSPATRASTAASTSAPAAAASSTGEPQ